MSRPGTGGVNWRRLRSRSGKGSSAAGLRMREWHATTRRSQNIISCSCFSWLVAQECFNAAGIWGSGPAALHPGFVSWGLVGSGCRRLAVLRRLGASRRGWPNLGSLALGLALDLLISLTGGSQIGTIPLAAKLPFCRLIGRSRSSADGRKYRQDGVWRIVQPAAWEMRGPLPKLTPIGAAAAHYSVRFRASHSRTGPFLKKE